MRKFFFGALYEAANCIMLLVPHNQSHFRFWWNVSEDLRRERDK